MKSLRSLFWCSIAINTVLASTTPVQNSNQPDTLAIEDSISNNEKSNYAKHFVVLYDTSLKHLDSTGSTIASSPIDFIIWDSVAHFQSAVKCSLRNLQNSLDKMQLKTTFLSDSLIKLDSIKSSLDSLQSIVHTVVRVVNKPKEYYKDRWGMGYEEGPAFRCRLSRNKDPRRKNFVLTGGVGYQLDNKKDPFHNALHEFHIKLGFFQEFIAFHRVRIAAYFEAMEKMKQFEAEPLYMETSFNRYEIWATKGRLGILFNVYSLKHFMITYRFGCELAYYTPPYIVNDNKTRMESIGNGAFKFGTSGGDISVLETIINNIGIYVYF